MGNPVVHFEIAGPDGPALQQFYRDLFGWNVEAQGEEFGFYGVAQHNEGGIGGGILQTQEGMPSNYVTAYIQVDDLRAALDKIAAAGGASLMPPMEVDPSVGSIAMFTDPANNCMGLYSQPTGGHGEAPPKENAPPVVHFEVGGLDAQALEDFYTAMFGWKVNYIEQANYRIVQQETDGQVEGIGGGIFEHTEGMPPNAPSIAILVDDLQAYIDKAVGLGGTALMQPTDVPGGFGALAIFNDIAGNRISLFKSPED